MQRASEENMAKVVAMMMDKVATITATFVAACKPTAHVAQAPVTLAPATLAPVTLAPATPARVAPGSSRTRSRSRSVEDRHRRCTSCRRCSPDRRRRRRNYY